MSDVKPFRDFSLVGRRKRWPVRIPLDKSKIPKTKHRGLVYPDDLENHLDPSVIGWFLDQGILGADLKTPINERLSPLQRLTVFINGRALRQVDYKVEYGPAGGSILFYSSAKPGDSYAILAQ